MTRPPRAELQQDFPRVRAVLSDAWNPVGVVGLPADEYDSYVWPIVRLLREGADADALIDHLTQVEKHWFGRDAEHAHLATVAAALLALNLCLTGRIEQ